ncbi:hypothetical protein HD806DRAFT_532595 [Xylariaceae sp. AK1471]|nr:hypothetical protein HD806DRAFT_532595 [Xylariaceae sp. AK1471]
MSTADSRNFKSQALAVCSLLVVLICTLYGLLVYRSLVLQKCLGPFEPLAAGISTLVVNNDSLARNGDSVPNQDQKSPDSDSGHRTSTEASSLVCAIGDDDVDGPNDLVGRECRRQPIDVRNDEGQEQRVEGMIDTLSTYTLMSKWLAERLRLIIRPLLESKYVNLRGVNGPEFRAVSFVSAIISLPNLGVLPTPLRIYIVETQDFGLILGSRAIQKLGLLRRLDVASSQSSTSIVGGGGGQPNSIFALFSSRKKGHKEHDERMRRESAQRFAETEATRRLHENRNSTSAAAAYDVSRSSGSNAPSVSSRSSNTKSTTTWSLFSDPSTQGSWPTTVFSGRDSEKHEKVKDHN